MNIIEKYHKLHIGIVLTGSVLIPTSSNCVPGCSWSLDYYNAMKLSSGSFIMKSVPDFIMNFYSALDTTLKLIPILCHVRLGTLRFIRSYYQKIKCELFRS